jgi:hypothetical protein
LGAGGRHFMDIEFYDFHRCLCPHFDKAKGRWSVWLNSIFSDEFV